MKINESIFKAYDIRGLYPGQLTEELAYKLGRAFVKFLGCKEVVVGKDMRPSSDIFIKHLIKGITDQGADVIDIGLCSTPLFYFAIANYGHESGIMITASHNPKEYNGFKMCRARAEPIGGDTGIQDIKDIIIQDQFEDADTKGTITKKRPLKDYADKVLSFADDIKESLETDPLKIVIDAGNGMGGLTAPAIFDKLNLDSEKLFFDLDGTFPNHEANPSKEHTLDELKKEVKNSKADLGIAFDGDADRVGFVDENGKTVPNDIVTALIAEELLAEGNEGEKILYEIRSSWAVKDEVEKLKGIPVLWKAGHSLIKAKMIKDDILFGGEKSGHYFFRDMWYFDCSELAAIYIIKCMVKSGKKLSELVKPIQIYNDSGEINFEVEDKDAMIDLVEKEFKDGKALHLDGTTIEFDDWWFNLRKSNTEPVIRLNLEAKDKDKMEQMKEKIVNIIKNNGGSVKA